MAGNEKKYCDGLTCWDRPKSGSTAGRRNRHVIVWNSDKRHTVEIKFRFGERPLKSKTTVSAIGNSDVSPSVSVVGKALALSLNVVEGLPTFVELRHQRTVFHIAVIPSTERGLDELKTCYQVACRNRRFDVSLENSICLATLSSDGERLSEEELLLSANLSIPLDTPRTLRLNTDPDEFADFIDAVLVRADAKIDLRFRPESEPVTPISGQIIAQQKRQRATDCTLSIEGEDVLKVQIGSEEFGLRHENRILYPQEQQMIESGSYAWRLSSSGSLEAVDLKLPDAIDQSIRNLIKVFAGRGTIPSLAYFDDEICTCVSDICSKIQGFCGSLPEHSQITNEAENLIQIGSIIDQSNNRILFTPLAPINLAYESALTKSLSGEAARSEVLKLFGQSSLLPFLQWPTWG